MVASSFVTILYLLAASFSSKGRQRYSPRRGNKRPRSGRRDDGAKKEEDPVAPPPPPTVPEGPFPSYFTCRHTYEETLIEELERQTQTAHISSPFPGLVRIEGDDTFVEDPIYALQSLPNCRIVQAPNSIKGLAKEISSIPDFIEILAKAPRASLVIHAVVPGMCKGQREPRWQRRAYLVADAVLDLWQKHFPAARRKKVNESPQTKGEPCLLQILLLSPDVAAVSLAPCRPLPSFPSIRWPNPYLPSGMAKVDIETQMPSSAYRKLLESFACWRSMPFPKDVVVDLGASPGGWTAALLLVCDCQRIIAVDRSELDSKLMKHPAVKFLQGDAFAYRPPPGKVK